MKVVQGSSRGGGGRGGRGGRGGGGRGGRGGHPAPKHGGRSAEVDPRFKHRKTDPKFGKVEAAATRAEKTVTDDRFKAAMKKDARFRGAQVDAHGRPKMLEDDDDEEDEEEDDEMEEEEEFDEGQEEEEEDLDALDEDAANWSGSEVEETDATNRIAVVNCDWDHISPEDIFAVLSHSLPLGGRLKSVDFYLSDFGKEQLEYEKKHGPNLWAKPGDEDYDKAEENNKKLLQQRRGMANAYLDEFGEEGLADVDDAWEDDNIKMLDPTAETIDIPADDEEDAYPQGDAAQEEDEGVQGERFSSGRYRQYELNRMKYYYCICTFDSVGSAKEVYDTCDGVDVEASGVALDLRFVPDGESFEENEPNKVRTVTKVPKNFRPTQGFKNAALTQTRFQIGWDQEDFTRKVRLQDAMAADSKGNADDLAIYIASSESDSEDEGGTKDEQKKKIRAKYAALLKGVVDIDAEGPAAASEEEAGSSGDDDDLNDLTGFGDEDEEEEEFDEDEEEDGSDDEEMPEGWSDAEDVDGMEVTGNMEASIDFNEDNKASKLQRSILRQQELAKANLGEQDSLKYKAKRKEGREAKKQALREQREAEVAKEKQEAESAKQRLKQALGDSAVETAPKLSGRERKKELSKIRREQSQQERANLKRQRLLSAHGVAGTAAATAPTAKSAAVSTQQQAPTESLDDRFKNRLVQDPRFHMDLSARGKGGGKVDQDLTKMATAVSTARREDTKRGKRDRDTQPDSGLEFFESRKGKK